MRSRWLDIAEVFFFFFLAFSWTRRSRGHKHANKERGRYPAISGKFFLSGHSTNIPSGQDSAMHLARSGSQSQHRSWLILPTHIASHNHSCNCGAFSHVLAERKNRQTCALELSPLVLVFPPFDFQNGGGLIRI